MELVAASKMKRAVSSTLASRIYAEYSLDILNSISTHIKEITHPLFIDHEEPSGKVLVLLITSNRGLCGAYNTHAIKKALSLLKLQEEKNIDIITIGNRGDTAMRRVGKNIIASFTELPTNITLSDVDPITKIVLKGYKDKEYDKVFVIYTDYVSALTQKPSTKQILPINKVELEKLIDELDDTEGDNERRIKTKPQEYLIEGDLNKLAGFLAEKITQMQIYQMFLESNASEQSARMMAMKNASEASGEMIDDLTLVFNKARQSNITREISEISAGMAAAE